jgi:HK97 family phage major capsid protein
MANRYLERLQARREELRATAVEILEHAASENRDVTDVERDAVEEQYREVAKVDEQIKPLHEAEIRQLEHDRQTADMQRVTRSRMEMSKESVAAGGQLEYYRSRGVGSYLADWGLSGKGDLAAHERIKRAQREFRVVADQLLADNPGVVPTPIVSPVTGVLPTSRPFIDSVTQRPMPGGGSSFNRPKITQHAGVGLQATEKTQLTSQKLTITDVPVPKKTYGGTLDISFQNRDWTDPAILAIAVADLEAVYANATDNAATDYFAAAVTGTFTLATGAAEGVIRSAFMTAASQIFANTKTRPDTAWMSPDEYAWIAAVTSPNGGPSFPGMGDLLGNGANIMGLRVVVDGNFPASTTVIGVSSQVEHYEQVGGQLAVTEPTILGYTIAYYGYVADLLLDTGAALKRSAV